MQYKTDIEIAQACEKERIGAVAARAGIAEEYIEQYGNYKAKVDYRFLRDHADTPDGKLILVTAITPTPAGEGKTTTTVGLTDGLRKVGRKLHGGAARALAGSRVRHKGRRGRRRLRPGRAYGGHKPALHRRLPRHRRGEQPARRDAGQPHPAGERPRHRPQADNLEARGGHERPAAPSHRGRPRRQDAGRAPRGRLRDNRRQRGHGRALPRERHHRPQGAARAHHCRLHLRREARHGPRPQGRGRDGGAFEGRAQAEPRADARGHAGVHPRRPLREHRPRLQLHHGDADGAQVRGLRRHGGGLRRRPGRGEVFGHQVPHGGLEAQRRRHRGDRPRAQIPRRRAEGGAE